MLADRTGTRRIILSGVKRAAMRRRTLFSVPSRLEAVAVARKPAATLRAAAR